MQKAISIEDQYIYIHIYVFIYIYHFQGRLSQIKAYIHALHVHTRPLARDSFRWEPSVAILAPNSPFVPLIGSHQPLWIEPLEPLKTITRSIRSCPRSSLPPFWHHWLLSLLPLPLLARSPAREWWYFVIVETEEGFLPRGNCLWGN